VAGTKDREMEARVKKNWEATADRAATVVTDLTALDMAAAVVTDREAVIEMAARVRTCGEGVKAEIEAWD
jgi:hypothetical protein